MLGKTISIFFSIFFEFLISGPIFFKINQPKFILMKNNVIIFTDLDGSLLNTQNFKFEKAKSLIKKITKDSNFIIPNSSKTELEIRNFIKKLKIKLPFISENGYEIYNLNTIERKLPKKIIIARDRNTILKIFLKNMSKEILINCDFLYKMDNKNIVIDMIPAIFL